MSEKEYIDFKKEFEEFKKELENSKPMFEEESIEFNDFDNMISNSNDLNTPDNLYELNNFSNINENYPKISLETDDISMNLTIKKDYSQIDDLDERKEEFIKDLNKFIEEFESRDESTQLMKYYDENYNNK